ncbi:hypothetical protein K438DRAFT_1815943 [Mycena galopus ATCC 62051]|nr:hypothetical protein K438DRAFT_1815943 [Mycena galopus ATCC 62051]
MVFVVPRVEIFIGQPKGYQGAKRMQVFLSHRNQNRSKPVRVRQRDSPGSRACAFLITSTIFSVLSSKRILQSEYRRWSLNVGFGRQGQSHEEGVLRDGCSGSCEYAKKAVAPTLRYPTFLKNSTIPSKTVSIGPQVGGNWTRPAEILSYQRNDTVAGGPKMRSLAFDTWRQREHRYNCQLSFVQFSSPYSTSSVVFVVD